MLVLTRVHLEAPLKSVGFAPEDAVTARLAYECARAPGRGRVVDLRASA